MADRQVERASNQRMFVCMNMASREGVASLKKGFCECVRRGDQQRGVVYAHA